MAISYEQYCEFKAEGITVSEMLRRIGGDRRTFQRRLVGYKARWVQERLKGQPAPITPVAPEGFEIHHIATGFDKTGAVEKQWVGARLEGDVTDNVPEGHIVKGLSTLVDESGKTRAQWIKTAIDPAKRELAQQAVFDALIAKLPAIEPVPPPSYANDDIAALLTLTDCHVGALAWPIETRGAAWDLEIAERVLTQTFIQMIDSAPPAALFILNQLGDFLHFDSLVAVTPTSGHVLDSDSRYQLVVQAATRILERIIIHAAKKFPKVHVFMHEGNHDMAGSVWLRVMFARVFRDVPNVYVELNPNPYQAIQWGKTMLGFHHGHLAKKEKLPLIFPALYRSMFGATEFAYIHTGHYHEHDEKEYPTVRVLQHPTIASPDAYAARNGYLSKRAAMLITYSKRSGEVGRSTFQPVE